MDELQSYTGRLPRREGALRDGLRAVIRALRDIEDHNLKLRDRIAELEARLGALEEEEDLPDPLVPPDPRLSQGPVLAQDSEPQQPFLDVEAPPNPAPRSPDTGPAVLVDVGPTGGEPASSGGPVLAAVGTTPMAADDQPVGRYRVLSNPPVPPPGLADRQAELDAQIEAIIAGQEAHQADRFMSIVQRSEEDKKKLKALLELRRRYDGVEPTSRPAQSSAELTGGI